MAEEERRIKMPQHEAKTWWWLDVIGDNKDILNILRDYPKDYGEWLNTRFLFDETDSESEASGTIQIENLDHLITILIVLRNSPKWDKTIRAELHTAIEYKNINSTSLITNPYDMLDGSADATVTINSPNMTPLEVSAKQACLMLARELDLHVFNK